MTFPVRRKGSATEMIDRLSIPYGMYKCNNGREVLFNREYQPIWTRNKEKGEIAEQADPKEWIKFKEQLWFYNDFATPIGNKKVNQACRRILDAFLNGRPVGKTAIFKR